MTDLEQRAEEYANQMETEPREWGVMRAAYLAGARDTEERPRLCPVCDVPMRKVVVGYQSSEGVDVPDAWQWECPNKTSGCDMSWISDREEARIDREIRRRLREALTAATEALRSIDQMAHPHDKIRAVAQDALARIESLAGKGRL